MPSEAIRCPACGRPIVVVSASWQWQLNVAVPLRRRGLELVPHAMACAEALAAAAPFLVAGGA